MSKSADPLERVCRALCRYDGHPENINMDGKSMWESYRNQAAVVLMVLKEGDRLPGALIVRREGRKSES